MAGEQTLKLKVLTADCQAETNDALMELLQDAKILSAEDIEAALCSSEFLSPTSVIAHCFPVVINIMGSLRTLAGKLAYGVVTHEQAVVAANQLFLTGCCLADSLALVGARKAYTVVDFLKEVGIDLSTDDEELGHISTSRTIIDRLIALGCIDERTIRVATRLRYLVCQRKLTCAQAWEMFAFYDLNKGEGEQIIDASVALAA